MAPSLIKVRRLAYLLVSAGVVFLVIAGDFLLGQVNQLSMNRIAAQQFRSEAAELGLNVRALMPGLEHQYFDPNGPSRIRHFRVGPDGSVNPPSTQAYLDGTKIIFLGGSTTENNEVSEDKRFPAVVERMLNESNIQVRVRNFGVRGHTSQESLLSYLSKPGMANANLVVLMHNINDRLWLTKFGDYSYRGPLRSPTSWGSVANALKDLVSTFWDYISYKSNILFLLRQQFADFNPWTGEANNSGVPNERNIAAYERDTQDFEPFSENLKIFVALVRARGAEPILMTQPLADSTPTHEELNELVRKVASSSNVLLIDLAKEIHRDGNASLFFLGDGIHFNDAGSTEAGRIISDALARKILVERGGATPALRALDLKKHIENCLHSKTTHQSEQKLKKPFRVLEVSGRYPSFSADGSWLLFQSWSAGRESIFGYRLRDARIFRLSPPGLSTPNERHPTLLSFSDQHLEFVFGSGYAHGSASLEKLKIRRWPEMRTQDLLQDSGIGGSIPAVYGDYVFFAGYENEGPLSVPNILSKNLKTSELRYHTKSENEDWRPAVSVRGDLAYISKRGAKFELFELSASGGSTKLVEHHSDIWDPAYSPDAKYLAFAAKQKEGWVIKLLDRSTKQVRALTDGVQDDWDPVFHPSGKALFFGRSYGREPYIYGICLD